MFPVKCATPCRHGGRTNMLDPSQVAFNAEPPSLKDYPSPQTGDCLDQTLAHLPMLASRGRASPLFGYGLRDLAATSARIVAMASLGLRPSSGRAAAWAKEISNASRARLTRLLMVPRAHPQMSAASS